MAHAGVQTFTAAWEMNVPHCGDTHGDRKWKKIIMPYSRRTTAGSLVMSINALFARCETGAEPPFGNLFNIETVVDSALAQDEEIVFNAGSHWQTVRMRYADYVRLVRPRVAQFACHL
jgi:hypothetical protein